VKAVDSNILIYAHREECEQHQKAKEILFELSEGQSAWFIAWPCLYEFVRVVTHPRVFTPPTKAHQVWQNIQHLCQSPTLSLLSETDRHLSIMGALLKTKGIYGNIIHDAHIAALLIEHDVKEIITNDDDFRRFSELKVINPFR
jgi:toxin-antitoxin system PIN domain toxin